MTAVPPRFLVAQRDNARANAALVVLQALGFDALPPVFDGQDALKALALHQPTVALLDCDLPGPGLLVLLERLAEHALPTRLIIHTHEADPGAALEAFRVGAQGYLPCEVEPEELLFCVRTVLRGDPYLSPSLLGNVLGLTLRLRELETFRGLRHRELEILELIAQGLTSQQIADRLRPRVSLDTVESHRRRIRHKLGITDAKGNALLRKALAYQKLRGGNKII